MTLLSQPSTSPATLTTELTRLANVWQTHYSLARRYDDPLTAVINATLSTAEMWNLIFKVST